MFKDLPPLNSLLAFEAASRNGSFKNAARELHQTPAAIAYQVRKLERFLKIDLFTRHHKGVELNSSGHAYYQTVAHLLGELQSRTLELKSGQKSCTIKILTFHAIAEKWLMPLLPLYRRHHPDDNISINATDNFKAATSEDIVIGYSFSNPLQADSVILMDEKVFPVCSKEYLKRHPSEVLAAKLSNFDLLNDSHWNDDWNTWLKLNQVGTPIRQSKSLSFSLYSMVIEAAVNGLGIMMGHQLLIKKELENGALQALFPNARPATGYYYLQLNDSLKANKSVQVFTRWLKKKIKESQLN